MLERLSLFDFQNHHKFSVALDRHVTTFVGPSDKGKSAVLRALKWLCLNQPQGDDFVGRFGKAPRARVVAVFDGRTVTRSRGKLGGNLYRLDDSVMRSFGVGVPAPVADLLNVGAVNFQGQLSPPFWFGLGPAEVSRELNAVVNLGAVDAALAAAGKEVRRCRAAAAVSRERLAAAKTRRNELLWVPECAAALERLEAIAAERAEVAARCAKLRQIAAEARLAAEGLENAADVATAAANAYAAGRRTAEMAGNLLNLRTLLNEIRAIEAQLAAPPPDISRLERLHAKAATVRERLRKVNSLWLAIKETEYELCETNAELATARADLARAAAGRCPACGQKLQSQSQTRTFHTDPQRPAPKLSASGTPPSKGSSTKSTTLQEAMAEAYRS